jgi:PLP dependent protein
MSPFARRIAENLARVRDRVAAAARRSGRLAEAITLVAVTKYVSAEVAAAVVEAGCLDLGESRPQELWAKAAVLKHPEVRWHMIGHLQRNKIRRTLPLVHLMQSVDSPRILAALEEEAAAQQLTVPALLEVNVSGDSTKTGLPPEELDRVLEQAATLQHVLIRGLMGMASLEGDDAAARGDFARLRELRDRVRTTVPAHHVSLDELSMGMSGDFEIAIEEGATIVRLGSILFEGVSR